MPPVRAAFLILVLLACALPATAQGSDPTSPQAVLELADRQDWHVRVTLHDGSTADGRVRDVDHRAVRLEGGTALLADIVQIERGERHGGGAMRGAVIGALTLGLAGAWFIANVPSDGDDPSTAIVLGAAGVGALIGGIIGGVADRAETEWDLLWPTAPAP